MLLQCHMPGAPQSWSSNGAGRPLPPAILASSAGTQQVTPEGLTLYLFSLLSSQRTGLSITLALKNVSFPLNPWESLFFFFVFVFVFFTISLTITLRQKLYEYVKDRELSPPMRLEYTWYCWNPANGVMMNYNDNSIFRTCFSFIFFISL